LVAFFFLLDFQPALDLFHASDLVVGGSLIEFVGIDEPWVHAAAVTELARNSFD